MGDRMNSLTQAELLRYSRHLVLPEVGLAGQEKLKHAAVLLVGTGGLGSPVALYLAAAGVGRIGIVDYDVVDESNLHRQIIHDTQSLGELKVESARQRMLAINEHIQVDAYDQVFTSENAYEIAAPYDILIDGTDNFATRYLLNDLAVLTKKTYIYGSIFRFEGQLSVFDARSGPCYRCLFPEPPPPGTVPSCAEGGVLGVLPGTIGSMQATEAIKVILGIGQPLKGKLLLYDALDMTAQVIQLRKNPNCKICSEHADIHDLVDYVAFCGVEPDERYVVPDIAHVEPRVVAEWLNSRPDVALLDVRDPVEQQVSTIAGATVIPVGFVRSRMNELDRSKQWVVFCRTGDRSARVTKLMQDAGFRVANLRGGINAWSDQIDPSIRRY